MIVTIDGPAGAGKSSVAKNLADRLGFRFLDTGATYRALTLAALEQQTALDDTEAVGRIAAQLDVAFDGQRVILAGRDVTDAIRQPALTRRVRQVADNRLAREHLILLQRRLADDDDIVTEGRDQGTIVFPHAECKFFVTASPQCRAQRRWRQLTQQGETVTLDEVLAQQTRRDLEDEARVFGRLVAADDAVIFPTDGQSLDEVVDELERRVRARMTGPESPAL